MRPLRESGSLPLVSLRSGEYGITPTSIRSPGVCEDGSNELDDLFLRLVLP